LFEEIETKVFSSQYAPLVHSNVILQDRDCACQAYRTVLNLEPHKQFTFAKLWILAARFEVRQLDSMAVRKMLGTAIGMRLKESIQGLYSTRYGCAISTFLVLRFTDIMFSCENLTIRSY
jgi:hypothetical protein